MLLYFLSNSLLNTTRLLSPPLASFPPPLYCPRSHPHSHQHSVHPRVQSQECHTTRTTHQPILTTTHPFSHLFSSCPPRYCIARSVLSSLGANASQPDSIQFGGGQDAQQVVIFIAVGAIRSPKSIPTVFPVPPRRHVEPSDNRSF